MNTRFNMKLAAALGVAAALCFSVPAFAQDVAVPSVVPYQGYLTLGNGNPVNNTVSLTFRLYANADDAEPAWTETHETVEVSNGVFYVYLGMGEDGVTEYFADGENNYLTVEVNEDGEASPTQKIGSVPYAILAGNAQQLGGYGPDYYATQNDIANFITQSDLDAALANYVTQTELNNAIANFITEADLNAAIANFVTQTELNNALANFVTEADLNNYVTITYLENQNYITQNQLDEAISNVDVDLTNYVTQTELTAILNNYVTDAELAAALNNYASDAELEAVRTDLQAQIDGLQGQIDQLEVGAATPAYILGRSNQASNGRINFQGKKGIAGANQMCRVTYDDEPTAHMCTPDEVARAIGAERWDTDNVANITNQPSWTVAQAHGGIRFPDKSVSQNCQTLNYNSGDVARGASLLILLDVESHGDPNRGQTGSNLIDVSRNVACGTSLPVMCCR